jgi:hypothetical protein
MSSSELKPPTFWRASMIWVATFPSTPAIDQSGGRSAGLVGPPDADLLGQGRVLPRDLQSLGALIEPPLAGLSGFEQR